MGPKVAFRATCAKNFPNNYYTQYTDYPGKNFFITSSQNIVNLIKTENSIQLFGKMLNTISVLLSMHQMENSLVHMTEFILFIQHHRYMVKGIAVLILLSMDRQRFIIILTMILKEALKVS